MTSANSKRASNNSHFKTSTALCYMFCLSNLLLANRIQQNWGDVTSWISLQKMVTSALLVHFLNYLLNLHALIKQTSLQRGRYGTEVPAASGQQPAENRGPIVCGATKCCDIHWASLQMVSSPVKTWVRPQILNQHLDYSFLGDSEAEDLATA